MRRLYLYGVAFVSLLTTLWGAIGLARSFWGGEEIGGDVTRLAGALSLILVGIPVFLFHWWLAQRNALKDPEERSDLVRAIFLYGTLLATLVPVAHNLLALLSRALLSLFNLDTSLALAGGDQTLADNLVAVVANLLVAAYFFYVLRSDWQAVPLGDSYADIRRLFRYMWMVYGLGLSAIGFQHVLEYALKIWEMRLPGIQALLPNGLILLVIGLPVWAFAWRTIRISLVDPDESQSLLRLVVLYLFVLFSAAGASLAVGLSLYQVFLLMLGELLPLTEFLFELSLPFSIAVSLGVVWALYGRELKMTISTLADTATEGTAAPETERLVMDTEAGGAEGVDTAAEEQQAKAAAIQAGLSRLYTYLLSLGGLVATFAGLHLSLALVINLTLKEGAVWGDVFREDLAGSLAALVVGLPLWLFHWRKATREAAQEGEAGDHARRSLIRRGYLYLVLFAAVIGLMFSTGALLYQLIRTWLGDPDPDMAAMVVHHLKTMALLGLFGLYHYLVLRNDNLLAEQALAKRHAQFSVLVLTPQDGAFGGSIAAALEREAPDLPVAVHSIGEGAPDEAFSAARAVVVPAEVAAKPSEALRLWLQGYDGARLVVPTPVTGWLWVSGSGRSLSSLARQTARLVRCLAEGEEPPPARDIPAWLVVLAVLGALFALEILFILTVSLIDLLS